MRKTPQLFQDKMFKEFIERGSKTHFGAEHGFYPAMNYREFSDNVPLRNYDQFEPYIIRARAGESGVLWDTKLKWFAKSSGTSSARSKFIPVTSESLNGCHFAGMKMMLANYISNNPASKLFDGDALTLGGSVSVDEMGRGKSKYGDLSAVMLSNSPWFVEFRRVPAKKVALSADFEKKVDEICKNALKYNVTNFSGVPSWNLVMLKRVLEHWNKRDLKEIWPNLELFMHGGIGFEPYRSEFEQIIGGSMNYVENYNASEGYFGFQDDSNDSSMLLLTDNGVFYEFIPMERLQEAIDGSLTHFETIATVKCGVNYAMVITTNGGLWRYLIGDSIIFTSLLPHKFIISGRTKLYINAFGEELMIHNAEKALAKACEEHKVSVSNYTVAPLFMSGESKGCHQWLIEFSVAPTSLEGFATSLDYYIREVNSDYDAKRRGDFTMSKLKIVPAESNLFHKWLKTKGKLGGQNKVPRLCNDRTYIEELLELNK